MPNRHRYAAPTELLARFGDDGYKYFAPNGARPDLCKSWRGSVGATSL
jgi:hypothetical protein